MRCERYAGARTVAVEPSLQELAPLAVLLLASGLLAGLAAGLLGVGGGIVLVPVLTHGFASLGIDPAQGYKLAAGTSLATIIVTAWRSMRSHQARGAVDATLVRALAVPVVAGVVAGSAVASAASGRTLGGVFAVIALIVALHMAFGRESWRLSETPPTGALRLLLGAGIGFFSLLMGLGGGTLGVPTLHLVGVSMHRAVGTAAGLGLVIAVPGVLGWILSGLGEPGRPPFSLGYVNLVGFALIVPTTILAAPFGARLAHALSRVALRRAFAVFLALVSARMFWELS